MALVCLIFFGPSLAVCAIMVAWYICDRLAVRFRRWREDPQAAEQRRAQAELRRLREFYELADLLEVERRAAEGIYDQYQELGVLASTAFEIQSLPTVREPEWS